MRKIVLYMILACILLLATMNFQEGYTGKYILKTKIVPPVCPACPQCPDLINKCQKEKRDCPPCKKEDDEEDNVSSLLPDIFGLNYSGAGHQSRYNDKRINYRKKFRGNRKPVPWLNSFSQF